MSLSFAFDREVKTFYLYSMLPQANLPFRQSEIRPSKELTDCFATSAPGFGCLSGRIGIRKAEVDDLDSFLAHATMGDLRNRFGRAVSKEIASEWLVPVGADFASFAATYGPTCVGLALLAGRSGGWAELSVIVPRPFQRQGIAAALTNFVLEFSKADGVLGLLGYVNSSNTAAVKLLRRKGFSRSGAYCDQEIYCTQI